MKKNFREWSKVKSRINDRSPFDLPYFSEREIWWCYLGANVGHEQDGKGHKFTRPILVVKKFSPEFCLVVPLSTQILRGDYFFPLLAESNIIRIALLHHIKSIDSRRLAEKIDRISDLEKHLINEKITDIFGDLPR